MGYCSPLYRLLPYLKSKEDGPRLNMAVVNITLDVGPYFQLSNMLF